MSVLQRLTGEQFLNLPDASGKQEMLHGELISLPPAKQGDNAIARQLFDLLLTALPPSRVWQETGYRLPSGWLQPDISVIWPDQPLGDWYEGSPMIAIEIASRGNTSEEIDLKVSAYLFNGAAEVWVVQPKTAAMTVFQPHETVRVTGVYNCGVVTVSVDVANLLHFPQSPD